MLDGPEREQHAPTHVKEGHRIDPHVPGRHPPTLRRQARVVGDPAVVEHGTQHPWETPWSPRCTGSAPGCPAGPQAAAVRLPSPTRRTPSNLRTGPPRAVPG